MTEHERILSNAPTEAVSPEEPAPEAMGRNVPGKGEAIEPEALHNNVSSAAVETGKRMWGPPGSPERG